MRIRHWIAWGLLVFVILGIGGVAYGFSAAGYEKYIVKTGSMVPELNPGDLVIDKPAKDGYHVGDVITFRHGEGTDLVTHRIVAITPDGIKTKGDANRTADVWTIPPDFVQGVAAFSIPKGGYVVLFLSQPAGLGAVLLVTVGLVLLWRLFFPTEPTPADADSSEAVADAPAREASEAYLPGDPSADADAGITEPSTFRDHIGLDGVGTDFVPSDVWPAPPASDDPRPTLGRHSAI